VGSAPDASGVPKGGGGRLKELSRFLRLERVRQDSEHEVPAALSRFSSLEEASADASRASHPAPSLERFGSEPAELELGTPDSSEPFIRCPHCGADSVRQALACRQCERRLDSEEVRAFNLRLWAKLMADRERESQELRERQALRQAAAEEVSVEEMAAREHARRALATPLGRSSLGGWGQASGGSRTWTRLGVLALGLPLLFVVLRRGASAAAFLVALGALLALALWKRR
jgi:hypothetical protein